MFYPYSSRLLHWQWGKHALIRTNNGPIHWCIYASLGFHELTHLPPEQNGRHFADAIFKRIFVNENVWISIQCSPKFVPKGSIDNTFINQHWFRQWLVACSAPSHYPSQCWPSSPTHICGTRGRWAKGSRFFVIIHHIVLLVVNCMVSPTQLCWRYHSWPLSWWVIYLLATSRSETSTLTCLRQTQTKWFIYWHDWSFCAKSTTGHQTGWFGINTEVLNRYV